MKKKGLSPVIATTLLVLLVVILGLMIFLWARGFLEEQLEKFGGPIEKACKKIRFDAEGKNNRGTLDLEITNRGNVDIYQFDVKMEAAGESQTRRFKYKVPSKSSTKGNIVLGVGSKGTLPEKITVYPSLIGRSGGENKIFTCLDNGKIIKI